MTSLDPDARDSGLAAERTDLAWNRSGLSLLACGAVVMRGLARPPLVTGRVAVGAAILGLGGCVAALGSWRLRRARLIGPRAATREDLAPVAIGVAVVGVAAFVVAALFPS